MKTLLINKKTSVRYVLTFVFLLLNSISLFSQPKFHIADKHGSRDTVFIDCDYDPQVELTAYYDSIYGQRTNRYVVSSIPFAPVSSSSWNDYLISGYDQNKEETRQDVFGNLLNLPFNFCFFEKSYNQIVISDNGIVTFNISKKNLESPYVVQGVINSGLLPQNSIFGVFHDMLNDLSVAKVKTATVGNAPYRQFVVFFDDLRPNSNHPNSSSQIVFHENSNIIDVHVINKSKSGASAIIGIVNDGTGGVIGYAPDERNNSDWGAQGESWRFSPDGAVNISVRWYNMGGGYVSGSNPYIINNPSTSQSYRAEFTFNSGCSNLVLNDTIHLEVNKNFTITPQYSNYICADAGETIPPIDLTWVESTIVSSSQPGMTFNFSYYLSHYNATNKNSPIATPDSYSYSTSTVIYVRVETGASCYMIGQINLQVARRPVLTKNDSIKLCDAGNDFEERLNLNSSVANIHGIATNRMYFYPTRSDAENNTNQLSTSTNYTFSTVAPNRIDSVFFRAFSENADCYNIYKTVLVLVPHIETDTINYAACGNFYGDAINVNLLDILSDSLSLPAGTTALFYKYPNYTNPYPTNATLTLNATVYVRLSAPNYCDSELVMLLVATDCDDGQGGGDGSGGGGGDGDVLPSFCDTIGTITVDLYSYLGNYMQEMSLSEISDVTFYILNGGTYTEITNPQTYSFTPNPTYYGEFRAVYRINITGGNGETKFTITAGSRVDISSESLKIDVCDVYNDGKEFIDLSTYDVIFEDNYAKMLSEIKYFATDSLRNLYIGDKNMDFSIKSLTISDPLTTIYVFINSFNCIYTHELELYLHEIEVIEIPIIICDFNDDGSENINLGDLVNETNDNLLLTYSTAEILSLEVYTTSNDAYIKQNNISSSALDGHPVSDGDTIFIRADIEESCPIIYTYLIELSSAADLPLIKDTTLCDIGNDYQEAFNLQNLINGSTTKLRIDFYRQKIQLSDLPSVHYLGSYDENVPLNYTINTLPGNNRDTVFVHVTDSATLCETIVPVYFYLLVEPELNDNLIQICDIYNDAEELVRISEIKQQLILNNPTLAGIDTTLITLHATKSDAENNINKYISEINIISTTELWTRIDNTFCHIVEQLDVVLRATPILSPPNLIYICNNNSLNDYNATEETISLIEYKDSLGLSNLGDYKFSFYADYNKALIGKDSVSSFSYTIRSFPDTVYVRVKNAQGCFSIDALKFDQYPSLDSVIINQSFAICAQGALSKEIDLSTFSQQMILSPYTTADFIINYHDSKTDAINDVSTTENVAAYPITPLSVVWFSFQNKQTGCRLIRQLQAEIFASPKSIDFQLTACDESDGIYDGVFEIDFDLFKSQIIWGEPNVATLYTFTYHTSGADAENGTNALSKPYQLDKSVFVNHVDTIFVRTTRTDKAGCSSISKIIINTQPKVPIEITWNDTLFACDGLENDGIEGFNLPSLSDISVTADSIRFYQHFYDAQRRNNPITTASYLNVNPFADSIFVRVSASGFCDTITRINLFVYPTYEFDQDTTVCRKELPFQYGDSIFSADLISGIYPVLFKTINGCDSLINLNVTVHPEDDILIVDTICAGGRYTLHNFDVQTTASVLRNVILFDSIMSVNQFGCDSITRLSLHVNPLDSIYIQDTICPGERYTRNGFDIETTILPDKQILTFVNSDFNIYGCDSITTLTLVVPPDIIFTATSDLFMFRPDGIYAYIDILNTPAGNQYDYQISHSSNVGSLVEVISKERYRVFEYGYYHITVTDEYGCQRDTTIFVDRKCPVFIIDASPEACAEDILFNLDYNMEDGYGYPDMYDIEFGSKALAQGFINVYSKTISSPKTSTSIDVDMPNKTGTDYIRPDIYSADLILYNAACRNLPQRISFSFVILYPSWIIVQKWNNVIALLNDQFNGGYFFSSYQWMKNSELLRGEDHSYIYIGENNTLVNPGDYYQIMLTRSDDGVTLPCCPLVPTHHVDSTDYPYVLVLPSKSIRFTVEETGGNAYLWNVSGILLGVYPITMEEMTISPPQGIVPGVYLLEINGTKNRSVHKIIFR